MTPRILLVIPTYNNPTAIGAVVAESLALSKLPVLIVDDGSQTPVEALVASHARVSFLRFEKNQGKGHAIAQSFKWALTQGYTHVITMDGDGQHKPSDLASVTSCIQQNPWSLIIGKRKFSGEHVPKSSQFGRKFSNFWVKYQTDLQIEDSQSGFRAYPLYFVQHSTFFTKKYDFEIEVLIRLIWKKVPVQEIWIDVYYPPPAERVSHFNKLWDNVKISLLNTAFVVLSLLHSNTSRPRLILSASLGVFVGVLPIYGVQVYIAALLSFVFRLNFPLMVLAQQVSLPPLIPLWIFLGLKTGGYLLGVPIDIRIDEAMTYAKPLLFSLILGSLVVGLVLAILTGLLVALITRKRKSKRVWTGKSRGGRFGNWFMKQLALTFGPKVPYFFLWFICPYFYLFAPKAVRSHNQFFRITQPRVGFWGRQRLVLMTFYKLGQTLIDNHYSLGGAKQIFEIHKQGNERPFEALEKNKGLVLIGAHMGAWMFAARLFRDDKQGAHRNRVSVVEHNVGVGQNASAKISSGDIRYIIEGPEAIFQIRQALRQNELVIFMPDRPIQKNIELVPFFGKLAPIDVAAFKIAYSQQAPIEFCFAFKGEGPAYNFYITEPVYTAEYRQLPRNEAILVFARYYTRYLEDYIRRYPTQWFNFFPFWSSVTPTQSTGHSPATPES